MRPRALAVLLMAALLAGCFGPPPAPPRETAEEPTFTGRTQEQVEAVASAKPLRYQFPVADAPEQRSVTAWFNGTVGPEANAGAEFPQDRGGTSYRTPVQTLDITSLVPEGQPTLLQVRLWYDNKPGASADLDILVEARGVRTHEAPEYAGEMAWTLPVKTRSVTTLGSAQTLVGIQAANGRILPGQGLPFWMRVDITYGQDVAAPKVPYALQVPEGAGGLVVESVKLAPDTHVQGRFLLVGPGNDLIAAMEFDDIALQTQSLFLPVRGPGTYVFYVVDVHNGFFALHSDAPLDDPVARALPVVVTEHLLLDQPLAPGAARHQVVGGGLDQSTEYQEGTGAAFAIEGAFPLEVEAFLDGQGVAGDVQLLVQAPGGIVAEYHRFLRADDQEGALGLSDDRIDENRVFRPEFLALGDHRLSAVVNGMVGLRGGVRVVTAGEAP